MGRPKKVIVEEPEVKEEPKKSRGRPTGSKTKPIDRSKLTRAVAVRLFCQECMGFQPKLVAGCTDLACPLWSFRLTKFQPSDTPVRRAN